MPARSADIDAVYAVSAGKFRRYHSESWLKQVSDIRTVALNIRDAFRVLAGLLQAHFLLKRLKPDVIFIKGGFVGVPVGLAAGRLHIPFITHDSDAIPGLANRLIAKYAAKHAVALPTEVYSRFYPLHKTVTVGVPVRPEYRRVTPGIQAEYRKKLDLPAVAPVLFVTGGGLGAQHVNEAVIASSPALFETFPELHILHAAGRANTDAVAGEYTRVLTPDLRQQVQVFGYLDDMYAYSGAADVVITRAGATTLADLAVQGKACIVIPNPYLTAGHQLKNAEYLQEHQAVVELAESDLDTPEPLTAAARDLLGDPKHREALEEAFTVFGNTDAAHRLAELLLDEVQG